MMRGWMRESEVTWDWPEERRHGDLKEKKKEFEL